jgi:hypothetical protein
MRVFDDRPASSRRELSAALFPERAIAVDSLFDTQEKRHPDRWASTEYKPVPKWLVSSEVRMGLEVLFFFGHPERRYEIWDNRAPCLLADRLRMEAARFSDVRCRRSRNPSVRI